MAAGTQMLPTLHAAQCLPLKAAHSFQGLGLRAKASEAKVGKLAQRAWLQGRGPRRLWAPRVQPASA